MAVIDQWEQNDHPGSSSVKLNLNITNDDPGAIYDSARLSPALFGDLADALYRLPANRDAYAGIGDLIGEWNVSVRATPTGEVYNGWNNTLNPDGSIDLSYSGRGADQWLSTSADHEWDTMALTVSIPKSQLELDGVGGYNPATDSRILLTDNTVEEVFVADTGTPAQAFEYDVHPIPEPATGLTLVGGIVAAAAGHRVRRGYRSLANALGQFFG